MDQFFNELDQRLKTARQENRERYGRFFDRLRPGLDASRKLERELGKHLAHRFNVLDYLRTDELGLSRIIADLLDPGASHGQGSMFLDRLLVHFHKELSRPKLESENVQVFVEFEIANQRRIDILVRIRGVNGEQSCLAIENKPYAGDQQNQVNDYLDYLKQEYADRFLLIYLSPAGDGPSEWSLPQQEIERWRGRLVIMPYHDRSGGSDADDDYRELRADVSLSNWLVKCRATCQVEKLRWFLNDAELFCRKTFGGYDMTTDSEARAVKEYLLSEPQNLQMAKAVFDCWPDIVAQVSGKFLEMLRSKIEGSLKERLECPAQGLKVQCEYTGGEGYGSWLSIYRCSWKPYQAGEGWWEKIGKRAAIFLQCDRKGPDDWWYAIVLPVKEGKLANDDERRRFTETQKINQDWSAIGRGGYAWADNRFRHWAKLMPELDKECNDDAGKVCEYYVDAIVKLAVHAIPHIDKIESESESVN